MVNLDVSSPPENVNSPPKPFEGSRAGQERGHFCWCPPGAFKMGHEGTGVTLTKGCWMGKYPVTQELYQSVMGDNPSGFVGAQLPVESVTRAQTLDFCARLSNIERKAGRLPQQWEYRLPTEAQWEYAARAGSDTMFPWGDDVAEAGDYSWHIGNSGFMTHSVGQRNPNPWGLFDMMGNTLEWCQDLWVEMYPGGGDPEVTRHDLPPRPDESDLPFGTSRGGGWAFPPIAAPRDRNRLGCNDCGYLLGFRVAMVRCT